MNFKRNVPATSLDVKFSLKKKMDSSLKNANFLLAFFKLDSALEVKAELDFPGCISMLSSEQFRHLPGCPMNIAKVGLEASVARAN